MSEHEAETEAVCVHEDVERERPLLTLPGHYGPAFGRGIPPKAWCWTHGRWEISSPGLTTGREGS